MFNTIKNKIFGGENYIKNKDVLPNGSNVVFQMINEGDGWYLFGDKNDDKWAAEPMAKLLSGTINDWKCSHPDTPIGINDISHRDGGKMEGHITHQNGMDVDLKWQAERGQADSANYYDSNNYSAENTIQMIETLMNNAPKGYEIQTVLFNDEKVIDNFKNQNLRNSNGSLVVRKYQNHDNHLHIELRSLKRGKR